MLAIAATDLKIVPQSPIMDGCPFTILKLVIHPTIIGGGFV